MFSGVADLHGDLATWTSCLSYQFLNYLLFVFYDSSMCQLNASGVVEAIIEEMILLDKIRKEK
jgi:hypothetical protein